MSCPQFLIDVLGTDDVGAYFPHRVTYHPTCHSLRMLGVGDRPLRLLRNVRGIDLVELPRWDECCGFGGTFAVKNVDTSAAMLADKMEAVIETGAEVLCAGDRSCLMHIGGGLERIRAGVRTLHLAEILASTEAVVSSGETIWTDDPPFPENARQALTDSQLRRNLRKATTTIRERRNGLIGEMADWQELRAAGAAIKDDVLRNLDRYLEQFEQAAADRGAQVHWARDADEANTTVASLIEATGEREVIKVKSMATQEIGLVPALARRGIDAYETDLAEMIVQLGHDRPSHIVVPAIHKNRAEIREIFLREMEDAPPDLTDDPQALAEAARRHLRRKFFESKVAISGANFAIAQTGSLLVSESEGNGRMCLTLPRTLISVVGIEKLIPTFRDLEVFLQLLPRSATGERMNPYNTVWTGVTPGDGPQEVHIVLLDNGRTNVLRDEIGRQALRCIRCAACLNVCPGIRAHRRPRVRGHLSRTDRRRPHAAAGRRRARLQAAVRLVVVRLLLRGLPREDRHPDGARQASPRRGPRQAPSRGGRAVRRGEESDDGPPALDAGAEACAADALRAPWRAAAAVSMDHRARPARAAAPLVSRLVGQGARAAVNARDDVLGRVRRRARAAPPRPHPTCRASTAPDPTTGSTRSSTACTTTRRRPTGRRRANSMRRCAPSSTTGACAASRYQRESPTRGSSDSIPCATNPRWMRTRSIRRMA